MRTLLQLAKEDFANTRNQLNNLNRLSALLSPIFLYTIAYNKICCQAKPQSQLSLAELALVLIYPACRLE